MSELLEEMKITRMKSSEAAARKEWEKLKPLIEEQSIQGRTFLNLQYAISDTTIAFLRQAEYKVKIDRGDFQISGSTCIEW